MLNAMNCAAVSQVPRAKMREQVELTGAMEALCASLASARLNGATVETPDFEFSLAQAYAMQTRVASLLGSPQLGWKVGSTSEAAQARLGTTEPGAGALLERFVYPSGAKAGIWGTHHDQVEVEFAFRMAGTLVPRSEPYVEQEVREAIGAFMPAMELVGSRFAAGLDGSGRNLVTADGGANIGFVAGAEVVLAADFDYRPRPCTLEINGQQRAAGSGAMALGDPIRVLAWLANHLSARGITLESGALVTTGTCTGLVAVAPGDRLRADFDELGEVTLELVAA
jgi:2-keto-4-pentenoate hydratase